MNGSTMRILFLSCEIPLPADNGDRIYTSNLLRGLTRHGHYVHLVIFGRSREKLQEHVAYSRADRSMADSVFPYASYVMKVPFVAKKPCRAFFSFRPGMIANRFSRKYIRMVLSVLDDEPPFDAIIVNHFKMAYLIEAIRPDVRGAKTILITHNAEAPLSKTVYTNHKNPFKKFPYYLDYLKMRRYEPRYLRQYDAVTGISQVDCDYFAGEYGLSNVHVLTPGIDLNEYPSRFPDPARDKAAIVCGSFLWEPKKLNLLYLLNCKKFHLLKENDITVFVVGQADPAFVEHVNRAYSGVKMTGRVADVRRYYDGCSIALIPELMGGGFKLKLLEAAALKKAVVALANAINAPLFQAGTHYIKATDFNDLVEKAIWLMKRPKEIERLSRNAYDLLDRKYTWQNTHHKLMNIIKTARGK